MQDIRDAFQALLISTRNDYFAFEEEALDLNEERFEAFFEEILNIELDVIFVDLTEEFTDDNIMRFDDFVSFSN